MAEQEPEKTESQEAPKKKKQLLLFAIIGAVAVTLIAAGLVSYLFFFKKPSTETIEKEIAKDQTAKAGGSKGESRVGIMVDIEPFIVNLDDPNAKHFLKVAITLEVPDEKTKDEIGKLMPKIKNEIIMVLSSKTLADVIPVDGKIKLRDELMIRLANILGQGKLNNVYFSQFVVQ